MAKIVADIFVDTLAELGVKRVYGIVGDSLNGITNAISNKKNMDWISVRHEEAAAFAAGADAQLTGELAVCAGSCGPGNMHLINGLYDAHRSGAPVLAIAAQIPTHEIGRNYFQETKPTVLFKDCSYFCEMIETPEQIPDLLAAAIQTSLNKRGVSVLVISGDMALKPAVNKNPAKWPRAAKPTIIPNPNELKTMATLLNKSKKITVLCGIGGANAHEELIELCDTLKAPMVHTLRGKDQVEYDNPFDVGMTGFIGFASGYYAMEACDTLLLLGTTFPYRQFYPENAKIIQVDIRGEQLGKRTPIELGVVGDVKATIQALLPMLEKNTDKSHLETALRHYKKSRKELDDLAVSNPGKKFIHPQYLAKVISEVADEDAVFTCDVGTPTVWAARYLKMNGKRHLLGSFNHGSMANALSQAMGAQAAFPERQIIAMCGDGGFSMLLGEVLTLIQQKLPVKAIIFNNSSLGFVELEMKSTGFLDFGTGLKNPNFADMANAIGIKGIYVDDSAKLSDALKTAFTHKGPAIVNVATNRFELIVPPKITAEQVKGFGLFMIKAVMDGRGSGLIELAKTNLWR